MTTFTFTLIAEGPDLQTDGLADALFEAGCDDALVGRADGIQYIDFDREAETLADAVLSAVAGVETIDEVDVVRLADAGLVSMADIAARAGRTRESVRLLITGDRGPGGFPPPVTDPRSRYRLWRASEVDDWFQRELGSGLDNAQDDHLRTAINAGLELRRYRTHLSNQPKVDLRTLVGL
ncbi:DNA-binding protein [soil metagenome]